MQNPLTRSLSLYIIFALAAAPGCGPGSDTLDPSTEFRFGDSSESDTGGSELLGVGPYVCGTSSGGDIFLDDDGVCPDGMFLHCDSGVSVSESYFGVCCNPKVGDDCTAVEVGGQCPGDMWKVCEAEPIVLGDGDGDGDCGGPGLQICHDGDYVYQDYSGQCQLGSAHACFGGDYAAPMGNATAAVCCDLGGDLDACNKVAWGTYCLGNQWHVCDIQ